MVKSHSFSLQLEIENVTSFDSAYHVPIPCTWFEAEATMYSPRLPLREPNTALERISHLNQSSPLILTKSTQRQFKQAYQASRVCIDVLPEQKENRTKRVAGRKHEVQRKAHTLMATEWTLCHFVILKARNVFSTGDQMYSRPPSGYLE